MSLNLSLRRNRFKNKPKAAQAVVAMARPFVLEWRTYARRGALLLLVGGGA